MSIFIAFFALLALALLIDRVAVRASTQRRPRAVAIGLAALLAVGVRGADKPALRPRP